MESDLAPAANRRTRLYPLLVLVLGLVVTATGTMILYRSVRQRELQRFENVAQATQDRIDNRIDMCISALFGTRALFSTEGPVTPTEFRNFVDQFELAKRYPGLQAIGFLLRMRPDEVPRIERRIRTEGRPGFRVWPEPPGTEVDAVVYLEPLDGSSAKSIGFDMYSEPLRREALERARDMGEPTATGKLTQVLDPGEPAHPGFLIFEPVYRGGLTPATVEERREQLIGYVFAPFRMGDLLAGIFGPEVRPRESFAVYDGPPSQATLLHSSHGDRVPEFVHTTQLSVAGRTWYLSHYSLPSFESVSTGYIVPYLAVLGVLVTMALFAMARVQADAAERLRGDIAARQLAEQERDRLLVAEKAARAEAESANRAKDDFLAMLGHELRNPLAPIATAVHLIKLRSGPELAREIEVIERQMQHLMRLLDDLLDVFRITRGKLVLRRERVEISAAISKAVEIASPLLDERRHSLGLDVPSTGLGVFGDEVRLAQIVGNLLTNAAKFTEPGGRITVAAAREDRHVVIRVRDNGIGIAPEMLQHVFEPFEQLQRSVERSRGGLGIGLTLVRRLVELHGGTVEARSEGPGRGSEFVVRLPLVEAPAPASAAPPPAAPAPTRTARSRRILLVDDNPDAVHLLGTVLRDLGHDVGIAFDGPEALAEAARFHPDIAILDIGLPVMDGYELASRLREELTDPPYLIAVSGYGQEHDRARSARAGFARHFVKPVDIDELVESVQSANGRERNGAHPDGHDGG
jgi:signal transduction histidine kinase/ActR/RegA family two-component response regulator